MDFLIKPAFDIHEEPIEMEVAAKQTGPDGEPLMTTASMIRCDVLYRKGQTLCTGYGSSKR